MPFKLEDFRLDGPSFLALIEFRMLSREPLEKLRCDVLLTLNDGRTGEETAERTGIDIKHVCEVVDLYRRRGIEALKVPAPA